MLSVRRFINTPVTSNCFVIYDKENAPDCIIVDPGTKNNEELLLFISSEGLIPQHIILTHEHFDHCWGVNRLVEKFKVPVVCSQLCSEAIHYEKRNCSVFYDNSEAFTIDCKTISVESLEYELIYGGNIIKFFMSPGHTDASISFILGKFLFTGDTMIKDLRTVTKLPTGSKMKLKATIEKYQHLQGKGFIVFAGHGDSFMLDSFDVASLL